MGILQEGISRTVEVGDIQANLEFRPLQEQKERVRNESVCLVIPPSIFLADERVFPFIGILKVAAELRDNGNEVHVLDLSGYANYSEIITTYMDSHPNIKTFGVTATTPQIASAFEVWKTIKGKSQDTKVILGGPHVTLTHTGMLEDMKEGKTNGRATTALRELTEIFDNVVVGDGEMSIFYAIDPNNPNKVIDAGRLASPLFMKKGELEKFSKPARELIDLESYHYYIDGKRATSIIAQLGCPFGCGFCGGRRSQFLRMARTRSIPSVIDEIGSVVRSSDGWKEPISAIMFYDDELNVTFDNLENLCRGLINFQEETGYEMRFRGFVKAERFTQEQADLMYRAGFREVLTGVESGSDKMLLAMKKGTSRLVNSNLVTYAHNAGLHVKALMSIGHPGESRETVAESIEWVESNLREGDQVDWTAITVFFGTPYSDDAIYVPEKDAWVYQTKVRLGKDKPEEILNLWSRSTDQFKDTQFYKGIPARYKAYVWTDFLSQEDIVEIRDYAESRTRKYLNLPPIASVPEIQFDHTMGMPGDRVELPDKILRKSTEIYPTAI